MIFLEIKKIFFYKNSKISDFFEKMGNIPEWNIPEWNIIEKK